MLSLAIGREGQNARLAAKLTGWRIDIRSETGTEADGAAAAALPETIAEPDEPERDEPPVVSATTTDETAAVADTAAGEPTEVPK
jgi:N utilization substance protein A